MKIKEIGKVITGKTPSTKNKEYFNGNIPFITPEDIAKGYFVNSVSRYISDSGYSSIENNALNDISILVGCIGSDMGNVAISNGKCATNQQINAITNISNNVNPYYLYYILSMKKKYLRQIAGTTTTPILPKSVFENINLKVVDINLQNKIVNVLKPIDDKIQNNTRIIYELESMAKTIYDYWFLQYEFPNEEGKPYKSSGGKMIYNEELKINIPEGWKVENLINNSISNAIAPGIIKFDNKKNYLATANVNNSDIQDGDWITYNNRESRANMQPMVNSVWFAKMKNSVKHITFTKESDRLIDKYILSTGFLGIKCQENALSYIKCFIYSDNFERQKDILAHGATQEAVNNTDLKNVKIQIPKDNILNKFSNYTYNLLDMQNKIIQENQELTKLRDELLPLLMNGQVSFKS